MIKISKFHTEQLVDTVHESLTDSMKDLYRPDIPIFQKKIQTLWDKFLKSSDYKVLKKYDVDLTIGKFLKLFHKDLSKRYSYSSYQSCNSDIKLFLVRVDKGTHSYYPRIESCAISKAKIKSEIIKQSLLLSDETKLMETVLERFTKETKSKYKSLK